MALLYSRVSQHKIVYAEQPSGVRFNHRWRGAFQFDDGLRVFTARIFRQKLFDRKQMNLPQMKTGLF